MRDARRPSHTDSSGTDQRPPSLPAAGGEGARTAPGPDVQETTTPRPAPPDPLVGIGDGREAFDLEAHQEFARLTREGQPAALVTVIGAEGSVPRGMGAAMTVREDGSIAGSVGGGSLELLVIRHVQDAIRDGRPRRLFYDFSGGPRQNLEKACLGKSEFFVLPSQGRPRLHIFGAGHIGLALAPLAEAAGFLVTVCDDRPGYPPAGALPPGVEVRQGPFAKTIEELPFDGRTFGVIVTYGHTQDEAVLGACLHRQWRYLGLIGSRAKIDHVYGNLATDDAARRALARVHAPIGLDLGGRGPMEIAISIAAELQAVRHGKERIASLSARRDGETGR